MWKLTFLLLFIVYSNQFTLVQSVSCSSNYQSHTPVKGCLIDIDNCIYFWLEGVSINWVIAGDARDETINATVSQPTATGSCVKSKDASLATSKLSLTFTENLKNATSIAFDFTIVTNVNQGFWYTTEATVEVQGSGFASTVIKLDPEVVSANDQFSFSCSKLELTYVKYTNETEKSPKAYVTFTRMQLQPFKSPNVNRIFADSFDCSTWFTIPTWMGFICVLLLTFIAATAVCFLVDIKTMDRFENPKSKPIAVPVND